MARVRVRMFATFREVAGCAETAEEAGDVSGLLDSLARRYGPEFERLVSGRAAEGFVVLVNGRNVGGPDGLKAPLADGDEVSLFPPISGG
jgi:molybdopterin synthase sulfur carrier subunit